LTITNKRKETERRTADKLKREIKLSPMQVDTLHRFFTFNKEELSTDVKRLQDRIEKHLAKQSCNVWGSGRQLKCTITWSAGSQIVRKLFNRFKQYKDEKSIVFALVQCVDLVDTLYPAWDNEYPKLYSTYQEFNKKG